MEGQPGLPARLPPPHRRDLTIGINMRGAFPLYLLAEVFQATLRMG